jgi:hypothetical protein
MTIWSRVTKRCGNDRFFDWLMFFHVCFEVRTPIGSVAGFEEFECILQKVDLHLKGMRDEQCTVLGSSMPHSVCDLASLFSNFQPLDCSIATKMRSSVTSGLTSSGWYIIDM